MLSSFTHPHDVLNTQEEINGHQNSLVTRILLLLQKNLYSTEEINHVPMWSLKCSDWFLACCYAVAGVFCMVVRVLLGGFWGLSTRFIH